MQVKKFEAPTIQEAIETIKRELGPEAIILQTKKHKKGFGLMSRSSVEVTAAVSERALQKKHYTEERLPEQSREAVKRMGAERQAEIYDKYLDKHLQQATNTVREQVSLSGARGPGAARMAAAAAAAAEATQRKASMLTAPKGNQRAAQNPVSKPATTKRYIDIKDDDEMPVPRASALTPEQVRLAQAALAQKGLANTQAKTLAQAQAGGPLPSFGQSKVGPSEMTIEEEVKHLKRMLEELKTNQDVPATATASGAQALGTPALQDAFEQLLLNGLDKRHALALIKRASFELGDDRSRSPEDVQDQLAAEIMDSTQVLSPLAAIRPGGDGRGAAVFALVGPTGVGKTTTVAKIASEALLKRNLKVGLINFDTYKVAAFDQLATYAKILNVPFRSATSQEDLHAAIRDFQSLDVVLIDTTGRSQRDPAALKEMHESLQSISGIRSQLVLSSTTRDTELYDMAARFAIFRPQGLILSKLDEATIYGAIFNVSHKAKLPLLYFTTGQRVPEDFEEATPERLAALILDL